MVEFKITIHKIRVAYLTGVALEAPDVVLLVQRHQRLPVLEILRAAGAPVIHRRRAGPAAPVGRRLCSRLNLLRPTRLGGAVKAVPVGVGGRVPLVAVGRGGRRLPALDALLT